MRVVLDDNEVSFDEEEALQMRLLGRLRGWLLSASPEPPKESLRMWWSLRGSQRWRRRRCQMWYRRRLQ
jgi:hypothetical protein